MLGWLALLVPLVVVLVGGWHDRWVQEDAFINFRIIDNLLAGHGPVFNVGERVEAYTDPLWLFLLAGAHEVVRFLSLAWLSVVLGLVCTSVGVVLGGRGLQRLVGGREQGVVLPIGLLLFSVVAGVWEFATSGLEMGMVFGWLGLSFWLLVRVEARRSGSVPCAMVIGVGTLVRPELALMSLVLLAGLAVVVAAPGWRGPASTWRRYVLPALAAVALPLLYQLWRMAYFALLVPNTALAKDAGGSSWSQGATYLWNFVAPYTLWLPLALAAPLVAARLYRWWGRDRVGAVVLAVPVVAGAVDVLYVVRVGGDYQHARLLLPAFLALCMPVGVTTRQLRSPQVVPVLGILVWAVACAGWLRYSTGGLLRSDHGIADERAVWVTVSHDAHPVDAADYHESTGAVLASLAGRLGARSRQAMVVDIATSEQPSLEPATTSLPVRLVANLGAIGVAGYTSGPNVYVFDDYSLANPIGSHLPVDRRHRPGQQKLVSPVWMVARFGPPGAEPPPGTGRTAVTDARAALGCGVLHAYLRAITAPLDLSGAWFDVTHSLSFTRFQVPSSPVAARRALCG